MSQKPRILLSEGSSLSAREAITVFGLAGHSVELMTSNRFCLGRFSKFVSRFHLAPSSGSDPRGYLAAVSDVVAKRGIDVLVPTHEQAYLFAAARRRLPPALGVALAEFEAFQQVQSKIAFSALLTRLKLPQPPTRIVRSVSQLLAESAFPFFVKEALGTASTGVWRINDESDRERLRHELAARGNFPEVVVQTAVVGLLERAQAVFDRGRLAVSHMYRQVADGPGGGDVVKLSVNRPAVRDLIAQIGGALAWHGALSFDYIVEDATGQPQFIDANPRLVEPMNAWLSGVDLGGALLQVSLGKAPPEQADGKPGIRTRLSMMGLLEAARRRGRRRDVLTEVVLLARGEGRYRGTTEELTPFRADPWSALPLSLIGATLLVWPDAANQMTKATVKAYSCASSVDDRLRDWAAGNAH
jgi:predicted ATP-grasp superfamily ATP-dependent carboligase